MKKILPILLCHVLMCTQAYAISGGPVFGGNGVNPVGTYSGVINVTQELDNDHPVVDPVTGTLVPAAVANFNAIGLFDLGVPQTGVATGSFILFVDGLVYSGTITASVDPDSDQLNGIVEGEFPYSVISTSTNAAGTVTSTSISEAALANGKITAGIGATRQGSFASAAISGAATIEVDNTGILNGTFNVDTILQCTVTGFRQSLTSTTTTITSGTSTTGGG